MDEPTALRFADVYLWVLWQFPRLNGNWLCGAIRPPVAGHAWIPTLIRPTTKQLLVFANLDEMYPTPEAAADRCVRLSV